MRFGRPWASRRAGRWPERAPEDEGSRSQATPRSTRPLAHPINLALLRDFFGTLGRRRAAFVPCVARSRLMASGSKLEVLLDGLKFGEAPRWHEGKLWFSDFYAHRVATVGLDGRDETIVEVPQRPSGLGWTPKGELLVVSMLDRRVLRFDGETLHLHADLAALAAGLCNDMVVDAAGRAYVGNFGYDRHNNAPPRDTRIIRVDPGGSAASVGDDLHFPNGMVITPDGRTLIVAETFAHRLSAFDVGADGALANRRTFAALDGVFPDGICLDAEGAVWVTDARGPRDRKSTRLNSSHLGI